MDINETPSDYRLLDETASLCKCGRSGRLLITVGSKRGAFFFKDGQLVDAKVGTLSGFEAVNLAVSSGATLLNFDSSIEPPEPGFTEANERRLLRTRFGIDAAEAESSNGEGKLAFVAEASEPIVPVTSTSASSSATTAGLRDVVVPVKIAGPPARTAIASLPGAGLRSSQLLSLVKTHLKTHSGAVQKLASVSQSFQPLGKQSVTHVKNKKTAVRAALIALIVIPVAVGFTSYWSKGKESLPLEVSPAPAASSLRIPAVAPSKTISDDQGIAITPLTKMPSDAVQVRQEALPSSKAANPPTSKAANPRLSATGTPADTTKRISGKAVADRTSETKQSGAAEVGPGQAPEEEHLAKPSSRGIAVEVRVEGGRVSEAFIKNRRPGLEAYEAAALRLARQRRYPKGTTTTETLVFQVNGEH